MLTKPTAESDKLEAEKQLKLLGEELGIKSNKSKDFLLFLFIIIAICLMGFLIVYLNQKDESALQLIDYLALAGFLFQKFSISIFLYLLYSFSKFFVSNSKTSHSYYWVIKCYLTCILICGIFGWVGSDRLGTHTEDEDPLRGGGSIVIDYVPKLKERINFGLQAYLLTVIPTLIGVHEGIKNHKKIKNE